MKHSFVFYLLASFVLTATALYLTGNITPNQPNNNQSCVFA